MILASGSECVTREIASNSGDKHIVTLRALSCRGSFKKCINSHRDIVQGVEETNRAFRYSSPSKTYICQEGYDLSKTRAEQREKGSSILPNTVTVPNKGS
jgi:hypothetical protein